MCLTKKSSSCPSFSEHILTNFELSRAVNGWASLTSKQLPRDGYESSYRYYHRVWHSPALYCVWNVGLLLLGAIIGRHSNVTDQTLYLKQDFVVNGTLQTAGVYSVYTVSSLVILRLLFNAVWNSGTGKWFLESLPSLSRKAIPTGFLTSRPTSDKATELPPQKTNPKNTTLTINSTSSAPCTPERFCISACKKPHTTGSTETVISSQELFASSKDVANLAVSDMATIFRYAVHVNCADFHRRSFISGLSASTKNVLVAMDVATSASRGASVDVNVIPKQRSGDVDALYFIAAVRIFADWRLVRLVPGGYKRYAMGMKLSRHDLIQNITKLEQAIHAWIDSTQVCKEAEGDDSTSTIFQDEDIYSLASPTLRQLLLHEIETNLHPHLPRLSESSGANGLLWMTRQLDYYVAMAAKSFQVPTVYQTTKAAVEAAYKDVYGNYHGWATQQVFRHSLNGAPELGEILNLFEDDAQYKTSVTLHTQPEKIRDNPQEPSEESSSNDLKPTDQELSATPKIIEDMVKNVKSEWGRAVASLGRFNCHGIPGHKGRGTSPLVVTFDLQDQESFSSSRVPSRAESDVSSLTDDTTSTTSSSSYSRPVSGYTLPPIEEDFKNHTRDLGTILKGIKELISEFNMNDPKKV